MTGFHVHIIAIHTLILSWYQSSEGSIDSKSLLQTIDFDGKFCCVQQSTMIDTTAKNGSKMEKREIGILKTTNLDSPYFLNSSDDLGRVLVTTPLIGENYHTWRKSMQNALFAKNKMGFVDGSLKRPNVDSPKYQAWTKCNSMVLSWLLNALSRDLQGSVAYVESAAEVWNDLHECFSQGNASRVHELKLELATTTQQSRSIAAYFTKLKPIWDELQANELVPTCTCGCTCGAAKESQILSIEPLPSLNKVYAMTTKEEKQQAVAASRSPIIEATALAAKMNHTGKSSMSGKLRCDHYKKVGHTKERCYEIIGYPVGWKIGPAKMKGKGEQQKHQHQEKELIFAANTSHESQMAGDSLDQSPIAGLSKVQYDQLLMLLGGNSTPKHSINLAGKATNLIPWIIDSGASDHMTPNISILQDIKPYSSLVHIPDGTTLEVFSIGKTVLPNKLTLNNNLASRKLIGMGKLRGGLYYCDFGHIAATSHTKQKEDTSLELWHQRLGHASIERITK
ncbi:hypothetical protein SLEP1_g38895 [Rubroshorea leprosula]|uniref:Retrotransposon Copia-like N-terminal domain-containing protein n=1 Tax=Rubroshorea leprosula TaxID=152421 RepID=A0AAV5KYD0_9ROSI|nr:hypothetical protein SLEP1_g38895 [Rubroshorea leprosula]